MSSPRCSTCQEPLPPSAKTGRPRRYCSKRCRDEAFRERAALRIVDAQIFEPAEGAPPVSEAVLRQITIDAIAEALDNKPPAPPEDQLIAAVIETKVLARNYKRLSREVRPDLSWRAERMHDTMTDAVGRLFEGVADDQTND